MGYYLMKCRKELKEILLTILVPSKYDDTSKTFYLDQNDINKIDELFYRYGFSEKVKERELRELKDNKIELNREKSTLRKA